MGGFILFRLLLVVSDSLQVKDFNVSSLLIACNSFSRRRLFGEELVSCSPVDVEPSVCTLALVIPLFAVAGFRPGVR